MHFTVIHSMSPSNWLNYEFHLFVSSSPSPSSSNCDHPIINVVFVVMMMNQIVTHARDQGESLRQKDDSRKQARERKKERMAEAKKKKEEELKRLKNMKKTEIIKKLQTISSITGDTAEGFSEMDLEGDFDPGVVVEFTIPFNSLFWFDSEICHRGQKLYGKLIVSEILSLLFVISTDEWDKRMSEVFDEDFYQDEDEGLFIYYHSFLLFFTQTDS